jgi:hypothetical protein
MVWQTGPVPRPGHEPIQEREPLLNQMVNHEARDTTNRCFTDETRDQTKHCSTKWSTMKQGTLPTITLTDGTSDQTKHCSTKRSTMRQGTLPSIT